MFILSACAPVGKASSINVIPPAPPSLITFSVQPTGGQVFQTWAAAPTIQLCDLLGNPTTVSGVVVTISIVTTTPGTPAGAVLSGTLSQVSVLGKASFPDLSINMPGIYALNVSATGYATTSSSQFYVSNYPMSFTTQPSNGVSQQVWASEPVIQLYDGQGNVDTTSGVLVTLQIQSGTAGATLGGTISQVTVLGVASFYDLIIDKSGTYVLSASAPGYATTLSTNFAISPGPPVSLAFNTQPTNLISGQTFPTVISVSEFDAVGNLTTNAAPKTITLSIPSPTQTAVLLGTTSVSTISGTATFPGLGTSITTAASGINLKATASGLASALSVAYNVSLAPTLGAINDQFFLQSTQTQSYSFSFSAAGAGGSNCADLFLIQSSNTNVVPVGGLIITGSAPNCALTTQVPASASGTTLVTLADAAVPATILGSFNVFVQPVGGALFSLRKLLPEYSGPAIQVRRSSDNQFQDIGFTPGGDLDQTALLNFVNGIPISIPPLEAGAAAINAYGLRQLRASYSGPLIHVRRDSDQQGTDIGFLASGDMDTSTLLSFAGAANVYVVIWYDQSGNGNDAFQTKKAQQPLIVNSGNLVTSNSRPAILFNNSLNQGMQASTQIYGTSLMANVVASFTASVNAYMRILDATSSISNCSWNNASSMTIIDQYGGSFQLMGEYQTQLNQARVAVAQNSSFQVSSVLNPTAFQLFVNTQPSATQTPYYSPPQLASNYLNIGYEPCNGNISWNGFIQEVIVFAPNPGTVIQSQVESSQVSYFYLNGLAKNAYVSTWYDQSSAAQHAIQTNPNQQPMIVNSGTVTTLPGGSNRPALYAATAGPRMSANLPFMNQTGGAVSSATVYAAQDNATGWGALWTNRYSSAGRIMRFNVSYWGGVYGRSLYYSNSVSRGWPGFWMAQGSATPTDPQRQTFSDDGQGHMIEQVNSATWTANNGTTDYNPGNNSMGFFCGTVYEACFQGQISEMMFFGTSMSAPMQKALQNQLKTYYGF